MVLERQIFSDNHSGRSGRLASNVHGSIFENELFAASTVAPHAAASRTVLSMLPSGVKFTYTLCEQYIFGVSVFIPLSTTLFYIGSGSVATQLYKSITSSMISILGSLSFPEFPAYYF